MARYRLILDEDVAEARRLFSQLREIFARAENAPLMEFNLEGMPEPQRTTQARDEEDLKPKYRISRSEWSYVDVLEKEFFAEEFSLDEAWSAIESLIETSGSRPRDGLRVALDRDDRFARVVGRPGVWFRRIDSRQKKEPPESGGTDSGVAGPSPENGR